MDYNIHSSLTQKLQEAGVPLLAIANLCFFARLSKYSLISQCALSVRILSQNTFGANPYHGFTDKQSTEATGIHHATRVFAVDKSEVILCFDSEGEKEWCLPSNSIILSMSRCIIEAHYRYHGPSDKQNAFAEEIIVYTPEKYKQ